MIDALFHTFYDCMMTQEEIRSQNHMCDAFTTVAEEHLSRKYYFAFEDKVLAYTNAVEKCAFKKGFQLAVALFTAK